MLEPMGLEISQVVSHLTWVWNTELRFWKSSKGSLSHFASP